MTQSKTSSTQMDPTPVEEELVSPTWQTWSSPEQPGGRSVAWETYYRNNTVVVRQGEHSRSGLDPRSDDGCTNEEDFGCKRGSQRDEQRPKTSGNHGNRSDKFGQRTDEQKLETCSNRGNHSDEYEQRRDEQRLGTHSNRGNHSDEYEQRRDEQKLETRSNRGNHSDEYEQRRDEQRLGTHSNRGNHSDEYEQRRDEQKLETRSNRGNHSDEYEQRRDEQRLGTRSIHGNRYDGSGQRRDEQMPETRSNRGNHSDENEQRADEQRLGTRSIHGNRYDGSGQRRDEQMPETRSNYGNRTDEFGQTRDECRHETCRDYGYNRGTCSGDFSQRRVEQRPETHSNRGNRSDGLGQQRNEQRPESCKDGQDCGYNRDNHSDEFGQKRDEHRPETRSNYGNRSDEFDQRRYEQSPETRSNRGNSSVGFGQQRDEQRPENRRDGQNLGYNRGNRCDGFGLRREEYRAETWRVSSGISDYNARNDLEQSRRRARNEYQPRSAEYQSNVTRYPTSSFNRNRSDLKYDSGFGNRSQFDSSESRNGNRRSTSYHSNANSTLGTNNWYFFDDERKSSPSKNRPFFEPEKCRDTRVHQDSPRTTQFNTVGTPDEEVWDLEPACETTAVAGSRADHEQKEARTEARGGAAKSEKAADASDTTPPTSNDHERTPAQGSLEVKPAGTHVTATEAGPMDTAAFLQHEGADSAKSHPPENLGQRQKLRERGLPNRPPKSCGFSTKYERWMAGSDGAARERDEAGDGGKRQERDTIDPAPEVVGVSSEGEADNGRKQGEKRERAGGLEGTWGDGHTCEDVVAPCESMVKAETSDDLGVKTVTLDGLKVEAETTEGTQEEERVATIATDESRVKIVTPAVTSEEGMVKTVPPEVTTEVERVESVTPEVTPEVERVEITIDESQEKTVSPEEERVEITTNESQVKMVTTAVTADEENVKTITTDESRVEKVTLNETTVETVIPDETTVETVIPDETTVETVIPDETTVETVIPDETTVETVIPDETTVETVIPDETTVKTVTTDETTVETVTPDETTVETVTPDETTVETVTPDETTVETVIPDETTVETVIPDETTVETVTPDETTVETVIPDETTVETVIPDETTVETVIPDETTVETVIPDETTVETVPTDETTVEMVTPDESGLEALKMNDSGIEAVSMSGSRVKPVGVEGVMMGGVAGCEETVADDVLELDVKSRGDNVVVEEEHGGSPERDMNEAGEGLEGGTGSTVGETDTVGDLGEMAIPQGDVTDVADGKKEELEETRADEGARNWDEVTLGRDGRTTEGAGVNKGVDEKRPQVVTGVAAEMRGEEETGEKSNKNITRQEAAADKVSDDDVSRDTNTGADNSESQTLSLTLLDVSSTDDSARAEVAGPLLGVPPGETVERVYSPPEINVAADDNIAFMMSYIESPSHFWVHLVTENSSDAIDSLMHDLNQYYKTANKVMLRKFFEGDDALNLNNICCAQFSEDNDFYRVEIVSKRYEVEEMSSGSVTESGDTCRPENKSRRLAKVKVFYIDFGNSEWLSPKRIYPLPPAFATLAPQAVCCHLVALEPLVLEDGGAGGDRVKDDAQDGTKWSAEAIQKFTELTGFDKKLFAYTTDKGDILR